MWSPPAHPPTPLWPLWIPLPWGWRSLLQRQRQRSLWWTLMLVFFTPASHASLLHAGLCGTRALRPQHPAPTACLAVWARAPLRRTRGARSSLANQQFRRPRPPRCPRSWQALRQAQTQPLPPVSWHGCGTGCWCARAGFSGVHLTRTTRVTRGYRLAGLVCTLAQRLLAAGASAWCNRDRLAPQSGAVRRR